MFEGFWGNAQVVEGIEQMLEQNPFLEVEEDGGTHAG